MSNSRSHPLRRISTGSLSNLARSQEGHPSSTTSPSNLDFLTGPLLDLSDEAAALATHVHAMNRLHDSLGTFNEAFAGYLYALRMNAFCVEWTETTSASSERKILPGETQLGDQTYATVHSTAADNDNEADEYNSPPRLAAGRGSGIPRAGTRGRGRGGSAVGTGTAGRGRVVSAAGRGGAGVTERKKREAAITAIIDTLPIEFRGGDPATRQSMEKVLTQLIQNPEGRKIGEIVGATDLPQPKVNKCLIALVGRKAVGKDMVGGVTVYRMN